MTTSTAITHTNGMEAPTLATGRFSSEERRIIKDVIAKGATDAELRVFLALCERTGLDPFTKQIYCIKRWDASEGKNVMTSQVSIDGLRILAERTGKYIGFLGPQWCGDDGVWRDVWLEDGPPKAARFGVKKEGLADTFWAVARWKGLPFSPLASASLNHLSAISISFSDCPAWVSSWPRATIRARSTLARLPATR